jgi:hypothetical protein
MKSPVKLALYAALVTALALPALSISALAKDRDDDRGDRDHDRGDRTHYSGDRDHYRGAPGPIAGAGLPILAAGYGAYWLVRRYRRKSDRL